MSTGPSEVKLVKTTNANTFHKEVEALVVLHGIPYVDAIVLFCEKNGIEIEVAASMIKSNAKAKFKIQEEAEALNFLPKTAKLPLD